MIFEHWSTMIFLGYEKLFNIPVPNRDVTYQTLPGREYDVIYKLFLPRESLVSDIPAGDGNIEELFSRCAAWWWWAGIYDFSPLSP